MTDDELRYFLTIHHVWANKIRRRRRATETGLGGSRTEWELLHDVQGNYIQFTFPPRPPSLLLLLSHRRDETTEIPCAYPLHPWRDICTVHISLCSSWPTHINVVQRTLQSLYPVKRCPFLFSPLCPVRSSADDKHFVYDDERCRDEMPSSRETTDPCRMDPLIFRSEDREKSPA